MNAVSFGKIKEIRLFLSGWRNIFATETTTVKALSVIFLSLVILLQPLSKLVVVAEYQVNKNYIAEFLCVNKNKPKLHCEGKCHLSKELKPVDAPEKNQPTPEKNQQEVVYFCHATPTFLFQFHTVFKTEYFVFSSPEVTPPVFGIFHPPSFLG